MLFTENQWQKYNIVLTGKEFYDKLNISDL